MAQELGLYTGDITYKGIVFSYVFDGEELRMIPPRDRWNEVEKWFMKPMGTVAYTFGDPVYIDDVPFLVGSCNENGQSIIFIPARRAIGRYNSVLLVAVDSYIVKKYDRPMIDRMKFKSAELDGIFSVNKALKHPFWSEDGIVSLSTKSHDETTSERQYFVVDGKNVAVQFAIVRTTSGGVGQPPLSLHATMMFDFAPTDDYLFIQRLWKIAKNFVQFLCYRKDIYLSCSELSAPHENGKHVHFADYYVVNEDGPVDADSIKNRRYIKHELIAGCVGSLLNDIAEDRLYIRHLPESYRKGRHIDAARFVMITAAFEWEFRRNYPNGIKKSKKTIEAENEVSIELNRLFSESSGRIRDKYRFLKKHVSDDSLQEEIKQIGKDYSNIVHVLGERLYALNKKELKYSEMGKRLSEQRNDFAHGNLDKEFIDWSLLDLIYLEYIVYALQLKKCGLDDSNIQQAINELFRCGVAL